MQYCSLQNYGCRILEYTHRNFTFLRLENDSLLLEIIPDKGADISKIVYKPRDIDFMWKRANVVDTGKFVSTSNSALGFNLAHYEGGWHESFPGGGPYSDCGCEQGLHGEAALLPWEYAIVEDGPDAIEVRLKCTMARTPFVIEKTIKIVRHSKTVNFTEKLINLSPEQFEFLWGHHPVFGKPFLEEGCRIEIPAESFVNSEGFGSPASKLKDGETGKWPRHTTASGETVDYSVIGPESEKAAELFFVSPLKQGYYKISNPRLGLSFRADFDKELFKCVWYWKVLRGLGGYPWYGATWNIGIEFWTGWPNYAGAKKNGTIAAIGPEQTIKTAYSITITEDK
jgi:galactose mutarotase-like enzyme